MIKREVRGREGEGEIGREREREREGGREGRREGRRKRGKEEKRTDGQRRKTQLYKRLIT